VSGYVKIVSWSARAPALETRELWIDWFKKGKFIERAVSSDSKEYKPLCKELKPAVRRRTTILSRFIIEPFFEAASLGCMDIADTAIVFASEHGEIGVLELLLQEIANKEQLSPIDFCNSVHHTPIGYLSMAALNRGISKTVSAGVNTFAAGLLESAVLLDLDKVSSVALLAGDLTVKESIGKGIKRPRFSFGTAMILKRASHGEQGAISLKSIKDKFNKIDVFDFLKELIN